MKKHNNQETLPNDQEKRNAIIGWVANSVVSEIRKQQVFLEELRECTGGKQLVLVMPK